MTYAWGSDFTSCTDLRGHRMDQLSRPHYVYEIHGADGPLYVGLTNGPDRRIKDHRSTQPWWPEVTRVRITAVRNYPEGKRLEASTIRRLRPRHNQRMNPAWALPKPEGAA